MSRRGPKGSRGYARTDRIGSTLREIIGDELSRIGDEATAFVTVVDVEVDNELTRAKVYLSTLNLDQGDIDDLAQHRGRVRKAIARQARLRRVPEIEFMIDPGLVSGARVESVLSGMGQDRAFLVADEEE